MRKAVRIFLVLIAMALLCSLPAEAKTIQSAGAEQVFFYVQDQEGKAVLLKVLSLEELKALSHGWEDGENYMFSATDNYPTTQYCEARGFTVAELLEYVKSVTKVEGAEQLSFSGADTLWLMSTDSYGNYSRSWTWEELYSVERYYFPGLFDSTTGWNVGWEIAGEESSKLGVTLEEYLADYAEEDPYYADKQAVFAGGIETEVILAVESYSGRTTSQNLAASTEPGIAGYIAENGGQVSGCLGEALTDSYALRLLLPMTQADLMTAHRTAYDNFKWIYNLKLEPEGSSPIRTLGTVAQPEACFSLSGDILTITFSCATAGADIYYGWDGAPQTLYTGPLTLDVSDRDLESDPVIIYAAAVREGYDDAGVLSFQYPGMPPAFETVYSAMTDQELVFTASERVAEEEWLAWTEALNFISVKTPETSGYITLDEALYRVDDAARTITFDAALFSSTGSYSFLFHNTQYANKAVSVTLKKPAPVLTALSEIPFGAAVTVTFPDEGYASGLSVYVTPEGGTRTMIPSTWLDRTQAGQVTIQAAYFTAASTAMGEVGAYTLELVNSSYSPASQTLEIVLILDFTDVPKDAWYRDDVITLAAAGVVNGVGGGRFNPDGTLTWGEALKLLLLACGYETQEPTGDHWASGYMDRAEADGLIQTGTDPDAVISRLEFCKTAAKLMGTETTVTESPFQDTEDPDVLALYEQGIILGTGDGSTFMPDGLLDRAQISAVIRRILDWEAQR